MTVMTVVVGLLLANGVLGAFDTLWYHEFRARLAQRPDLYRTELRLHALRDAVYAVLYGTIGWWAWNGGWAFVLASLLAIEITVTMADFVVEDKTRTLSGGERVLHALMAIVYGAMLAHLAPVLFDRAQEPTSLWGGSTDVPVEMAIVASLLGVGIAASGVRDWVASASGDPGVHKTRGWLRTHGSLGR